MRHARVPLPPLARRRSPPTFDRFIKAHENPLDLRCRGTNPFNPLHSDSLNPPIRRRQDLQVTLRLALMGSRVSTVFLQIKQVACPILDPIENNNIASPLDNGNRILSRRPDGD
jgi:hypothetical protein